MLRLVSWRSFQRQYCGLPKGSPKGRVVESAILPALSVSCYSEVLDLRLPSACEKLSLTTMGVNTLGQKLLL